MSKVMRSVKNVTKGYSHAQVKVRNATSNDPWGPTGTDMQEISQMTYNSSNEFYEIMDMLDKRLNDKGKNWRHVLKALKVLDYILHEGSELVVTWARKNIYIIKTLREFQYVDDDGRDVGANVRVSAKELTTLVLDEERLRNERNDRKSWKSRVTGIEEYQSGAGPSGSGSGDYASPRRPSRANRGNRTEEEDAEYKLALEASKYQEEEDRRKRESRHGQPDDDDDLAKAIKLSKEEEELRRRELEDQNAASLFDDTPAPTNQPQYTGFNQGYQQQSAVDWSGNPIDGVQTQPTGYPNAYANPTGFQTQPTGYQNGFQNGFQQNGFGAQPTGFDPYGQQQQQQQQQPQPAFAAQPAGYNPYLQPQQPQSPEPIIPASTNNPWATTNHQMSSPLQATPTGSNNPFAAASSNPARPSPFSSQTQPTLSTLQEQKTMSQFNNNSNFNPPTSFSTPPGKSQTPYEAKLSSLLETGEGQDTFGNVGNLRIPAQHTAPGTFVNSAGAGLSTVNSQATGNNPYMQTQFTGMPQTSYGGHQIPAATGPANFGFGSPQSANPFGPRPGQQQHGQGGDLIQF